MVQSGDSVKVIVGVEIHVELGTATKMFCRCRNSFGDPPNTNVCPVCIGMPGVLPVMNRQAVEFSMKVGLALGCTVNAFTKWDRKSYYYPDLPKNYQISQYDLPLSSNGFLEVPLPDGTIKRVRVLRAHLEEDAGKNVHDNPTHTGVDLNRAGLPLLEIVSEPDMHSTDEVVAYAKAMQRLVRWLGVSQANMQMGQMRFEPNINLHITRGGVVYKTPIIEVKNLNSFKALQGSVDYEITRQYEAWREDPEGFTLAKQGKQNRGFDDAKGQTVFQRGKEEAHDYRYFPDPDLAPVRVDDAWRTRVAAEIRELPLARRARYMEQHKLTFKEADALTQEAPTGDLLDDAVAAGADAKRCANLLLGRGAAIANEREVSIAEIGLTAGQLGTLAKMMDAGEVNATAGAKIFDLMIQGCHAPADVVVAGACADTTPLPAERDPHKIAEREGLLAVKDSDAIEKWVDQAIAANPQAAADVREGGKKQAKAFGFLTGQVMKLSRGAAQPAQVQQLLQAKLGGPG